MQEKAGPLAQKAVDVGAEPAKQLARDAVPLTEKATREARARRITFFFLGLHVIALQAACGLVTAWRGRVLGGRNLPERHPTLPDTPTPFCGMCGDRFGLTIRALPSLCSHSCCLHAERLGVRGAAQIIKPFAKEAAEQAVPAAEQLSEGAPTGACRGDPSGQSVIQQRQGCCVWHWGRKSLSLLLFSSQVNVQISLLAYGRQTVCYTVALSSQANAHITLLAFGRQPLYCSNALRGSSFVTRPQRSPPRHCGARSSASRGRRAPRAGLLKPVAHQVAESLEPITKDLTRGALQPLAKGLAENAVPVANDFADNTLLPAADMIAEQARLAGGPGGVVGAACRHGAAPIGGVRRASA